MIQLPPIQFQSTPLHHMTMACLGCRQLMLQTSPSSSNMCIESPYNRSGIAIPLCAEYRKFVAFLSMLITPDITLVNVYQCSHGIFQSKRWLKENLNKTKQINIFLSLISYSLPIFQSTPFGVRWAWPTIFIIVCTGTFKVSDNTFACSHPYFLLLCAAFHIQLSDTIRQLRHGGSLSVHHGLPLISYTSNDLSKTHDQSSVQPLISLALTLPSLTNSLIASSFLLDDLGCFLNRY